MRNEINDYGPRCEARRHAHGAKRMTWAIYLALVVAVVVLVTRCEPAPASPQTVERPAELPPVCPDFGTRYHSCPK